MNTVELDTSKYTSLIDRMRAAVAIADAVAADPESGVVVAFRGRGLGDWDPFQTRRHSFDSLDTCDYRFVPAPPKPREFYTTVGHAPAGLIRATRAEAEGDLLPGETVIKVREVLE